MNMNMAGQTINDRLLAARHSLAGQGLAKSVCKATTEEMIGPKKKHLDCEFLPFFAAPLFKESQSQWQPPPLVPQHTYTHRSFSRLLLACGWLRGLRRRWFVLDQ